MNFPYMTPTKNKAQTLKEFSGTTSAIHPAFHSLDHLQDSLNVFNKDGILTTRNGFLKTSKEDISDFWVTSTSEQAFFADFPFTEIQGYNTLGMLSREELMSHTVLDFFVVDDFGNMKKICCQEIVAPNGYTMFQVLNAFFIKSTPSSDDRSGLYVLIPVIRIDMRQGITTHELLYYEFTADYSRVYYTTPKDFYRPLIMKHGHGDHYHLCSEDPIKDTEYPEGVNILTGGFEADFSTDDNSDTFRLPVSIKEASFITIRYYTGEKSYRTFTIFSNSDTSDTQEFLDVNLYFKVDRKNGIVHSMSQNGLYILPRYRKDNSLRIYAYTETGDAPFNLFSHRSKPVSFDGRLFFPGGLNCDNKVYYSGKNQPLYYCEENSFTVGDSHDSVTALSKQGRYIIAFKDKEIYRITLSESEAVDRETLINDDSVKKMPQPDKKVIRVNDTIGCDKPSTIRNCGNRLVWYHSDGGVYTLYGSNLYTEGSVYELSGEIRDKLVALSDEDKANIKAIEIEGRYALATRKKIFIMDTNVSGFSYLSGHKPADKRYGGLPWFIWSSPKGMNIINSYTKRGNAFFVMSSDDYKHFDIAKLTGYLDTIYENGQEKLVPTDFSFTTALMGVDHKGTEKISFDAIFENFAEASVFDINGEKVHAPVMNYNKFIHYYITFNYIRGKLGLKISGNGLFELCNISYIIKE